MEDTQKKSGETTQGPSCNAKVSTGFYVFLVLIAILAAIAYFVFWR
jgi:hypothetical protein